MASKSPRPPATFLPCHPRPLARSWPFPISSRWPTGLGDLVLHPPCRQVGQPCRVRCSSAFRKPWLAGGALCETCGATDVPWQPSMVRVGVGGSGFPRCRGAPNQVQLGTELNTLGRQDGASVMNFLHGRCFLLQQVLGGNQLPLRWFPTPIALPPMSWKSLRRERKTVHGVRFNAPRVVVSCRRQELQRIPVPQGVRV